jgi:anaerobic selenocysteine-containing dehydrogenase
VLPVASAWEREGLRVGFELDAAAQELVQLRPAVVPPRGEARSDVEIVFDLATRLGLGDRFWHGDIEAGMRHHLAPSGLTPEGLRGSPGGIRVPLTLAHRKYRDTGFRTPSGKLEIFSETLQAHGYAPLPVYEPPAVSPESRPDLASRYPLILTSAKSPHYCHSQHRSLARLRRLSPHPSLEIHPQTAAARGIAEGDWVSIATPAGRARAVARLQPSLDPSVVAAQHGWWQGCAALGLPGYDPFSPEGANYNLLIGNDVVDPISGSVPHRSYVCEIERVTDGEPARR